MTDQTFRPATLPVTNSTNTSSLWNSLTQPHSSLKGDDRRKAFSLAALTLVFIPLAFSIVLLQPLMTIVKGEELYLPNIGSVMGLLIITVSYAFSRSRHYVIGAYLTVASPMASVIVAALSLNAVISDMMITYLSLGVILSSLLLTSRDTLVIGIIATLAAAILFYVTKDRTPDAVFQPSIILYIVITTAVLTVVDRIREDNLKQLESTQSELNQRMIEVAEARDQAEHSNQVKSIFLASMSHELRTPLNAIINFTRFVSKGTLGPVNETQVETLDNVIISGKHLLNLINDVLDMSKIESGSLSLFVSDEVDIDEIVDEVYATGRALLSDKEVELKKEVVDDLPLIMGDQQRIRQILLNIISNACKFTEDGRITISVKKDIKDVIIAITDTGPGIAEKDQASVFEAFKQTETGLRQSGGTGLGMPITKSLVEAHGGEIHLESSVGAGATFTVRLPIRSDILTPTLVTEA